MTTSTIFFAHQNCIDFGYIRHDGAPIGYSVNPSFTLTGRIEEKEQVVIDFSDSKKKLKDFMDASFDHRLVFFRHPDGSLAGVETHENNAETDLTTFHLSNGLGTISLPEDAFVFVDIVIAHQGNEDRFVQMNLQAYLKDYCEKAMADHYGFPVQVGVKMAAHMMSFGEMHDLDIGSIDFQYVHGLKNSSSYGCKNIAHGHLSYLHFQEGIQIPLDKLHQVSRDHYKLKQLLTNCIFVNRENLTQQEQSPEEVFNVISYSTEQRGFMEMALNMSVLADIPDVHVHICEKETTIENLAEYVSILIAKECPDLSELATELYISEGLTKGCLYDREIHIQQYNSKAA